MSMSFPRSQPVMDIVFQTDYAICRFYTVVSVELLASVHYDLITKPQRDVLFF